MKRTEVLCCGLRGASRTRLRRTDPSPPVSGTASTRRRSSWIQSRIPTRSELEPRRKSAPRPGPTDGAPDGSATARSRSPILGLGCMSHVRDIRQRATTQQSIAVIHRALDLRVNLLDSADMYGWGHNEELIGRALKGGEGAAVLATKFGQVRGADGANHGATAGRRTSSRRATRACRRLGVDEIDLYYQHRVDPKVSIEETVGAMSRLVERGKVRSLGLSEAAPATIRRAHSVHPISAVQLEYSLLYRQPRRRRWRRVASSGSRSSRTRPSGADLLSGRIQSAAEIPRMTGSASIRASGRELRAQPAPRRPDRRRSPGRRDHAVPARPGVAAGPGERRRADPRDRSAPPISRRTSAPSASGCLPRTSRASTRPCRPAPRRAGATPTRSSAASILWRAVSLPPRFRPRAAVRPLSRAWSSTGSGLPRRFRDRGSPGS